MTSPQVWLSGATGFLGRQIALNLGEDAVLTSRSGGEVEGRRVHAVDLMDEAAVEVSARGSTVAILSAGSVSRKKRDAGVMHQLHVTATQSALSALERAGVRRVVLVSSSGTLAVSDEPGRVDDELSGDPLRFIASLPYYRSKYYGEQAALERNHQKFEVVVVNPSLLLGPGDLRESSTEDVRIFLERSVLAAPAGGIAFVDVRDAARGVLAALERGRAGERYLLSGANMTLATFFARLSRISGIPAPHFRLPRDRALTTAAFAWFDRGIRALGGTPPVDAESIELAQLHWYCSAEKAERELGFQARDPGETLRDTVDDLIARRVVAAPPTRSPSGG